MAQGGAQRKHRVLAILHGPTADSVLDGDHGEKGPLEELAGLPGDAVEVRCS
jgi:hypothetical protein